MFRKVNVVKHLGMKGVIFFQATELYVKVKWIWSARVGVTILFIFTSILNTLLAHIGRSFGPHPHTAFFCPSQQCVES